MDSYVHLVLTVLCLYFTGTCISLDVSTSTLPSSCDLKNDTCPDLYCCVRDDFFFKETYCKQLGGDGSSCVTHVSDFECPCQHSFYCATNIHGHIASVFGKCLSKPTTTGGPMDTTPSNEMATTSPGSQSTGISNHNDNTTSSQGNAIIIG